ncbi:hypothetical protein [Plantactinospora endophytica]|nr:hypothetical protein [Plantactinospora endophytica]
MAAVLVVDVHRLGGCWRCEPDGLCPLLRRAVLTIVQYRRHRKTLYRTAGPPRPIPEDGTDVFG